MKKILGIVLAFAILLSLFWKRLNFLGALTGIIAGAAVDILWLAFLSSTGVYEIVPGFLCGLLATVAVSLMGREPGAEVLKLFDRVASKEEI